MTRCLSLVGFLLAWNCCTLTSADEPGTKPDKPEQTKRPFDRRFDREKLTRFRERLRNRNSDASRLKRVSWNVGDVTREALVHVPPSTNKTTKPSLVFAFHGHGGKAENAARRLAFHEYWPEAVCVYPQGLPTAVPVIDVEGRMPGWQKFIGDQKDRDLEFFDAMLESMKVDYQIDESRVYAAGHSNGGFFTYVLWAARGDTLAAVAPIAAHINPRDFKNQKPKPVLHVAGENDRLVRFSLQERTMDQIRKLNGCDPEGKPAGPFSMEYTSRSGPPVVTLIHSGGHEIPEDAPRRIVQFFKEHAKM